MIKYTENDLLRIAKRFYNKKRTYLLVDPLQAKHIPVSPSKTMDMFRVLGDMVRAEHPDTELVIGFAETATAVGMAVAAELDDRYIYIHTTREDVDSVDNWIEFKEEHSHAVQQRLAASIIYNLKKYDIVLIITDSKGESERGIQTLTNALKQEGNDEILLIRGEIGTCLEHLRKKM